MKSSLIKIICPLALVSLFAVVNSTEVSATSDVDTYIQEEVVTSDVSEELQSLDNYVEVKNNQYELNVPSNASVSPKLIEEASNMIESSNEIVRENNLIIDPNSKVAKEAQHVLSARAKYVEGKSGVELHWNYARVFVSKSAANAIKGGGMAAAGFLAGKVPNAYVEFGSVVLLGILGSIDIKGGFYFDFNYVLGNMGYHWQ